MYSSKQDKIRAFIDKLNSKFYRQFNPPRPYEAWERANIFASVKMKCSQFEYRSVPPPPTTLVPTNPGAVARRTT